MSQRLADRTLIRLAIFALLALALVWPLLGDAARFNEFRDSQVLMLYERAAVDAVKKFGELPLWNPYYCGGLDGLGAPQSRFASPTFLLSLLFGPERAEIVIVFSMTLLGMEGTFRWIRLRVTSPLAAALVAPAFALSGHFSVAFYRGWTAFFGFQLVPWILLGVTLAARGRVRGLALASIGFAIVLGFGGTFAAPLIAVAAVLEGLRAASERPASERVRALAMLLAAASFMAAVAFLRLWPLAETLSSAPRIMAGTPGHAPKAIFQALADTLNVKDGDIERPGSFFVGGAFLALVALGGSDRRALRSVGIVIVLVWLAAGYARKPTLFGMLRELPVFSALRYPERFLWLAILFACEPAAIAIAKLPIIGDGRRWRIGAWVAVTALMLWTIAGEVRTFWRVGAARTLGALTSSAPEGGFHQSRGNRWLAAHVQATGTGSLSCWETHPVFMSPLLRGDLPQEEYPEDPTNGVVKRRSWSPNSIVLEATLERAGRVLVNQNWHPGWRASLGNVAPHDGLLAVDLPGGRNMVTLAFRPWSTTGGAWVTCVALAALGILGLRSRNARLPFARGSRLATALLVVLPWGVAFAAYRMSPEPPWPTHAPRNANGTAALVAAIPKDGPVVRVDASFSLPIRLEGARITGPDAHQTLHLDVYLKRLGKLSRTTAMFVHFERRDPAPEPPKDHYAFLNADHQVVGGSFFLSDAPEDQLVHDAFAARLDKAAPGTWDVWIAFGSVTGRSGRAKVTAPATTTVDKDRVRIGTFEIH